MGKNHRNTWVEILKTIENNAEFHEFDQDLHTFGTMYQNVSLDGVEKMHTDKYISTGTGRIKLLCRIFSNDVFDKHETK